MRLRWKRWLAETMDRASVSNAELRGELADGGRYETVAGNTIPEWRSGKRYVEPRQAFRVGEALARLRPADCFIGKESRIGNRGVYPGGLLAMHAAGHFEPAMRIILAALEVRTLRRYAASAVCGLWLSNGFLDGFENRQAATDAGDLLAGYATDVNDLQAAIRTLVESDDSLHDRDAGMLGFARSLLAEDGPSEGTLLHRAALVAWGSLMIAVEARALAWPEWTEPFAIIEPPSGMPLHAHALPSPRDHWMRERQRFQTYVDFVFQNTTQKRRRTKDA